MEKKLNLGCGNDYKEGYINIDWNKVEKADVYQDLNNLPYPFEDNSFDEVYAQHILEHLDRPFAIIEELHRILKPNGLLHIKVPHCSRGFTHAEHQHGFDVTLPSYFNKNFTGSGYFGVDFKLEKMELHWMAFLHFLQFYGYGKLTIMTLTFVNSIITSLANLNQHLCSRIWCYWVGGFEEIEYKFRCDK